MSLYLLAVTPLTFFAACALLREQSPCVPIDLWRRFLLGGLLALPGYLAAGVVADWFGSSYGPVALFVRLTATGHLLPAGMAAAAALVLGLASAFGQRRGAGGDALAVLAPMSGFSAFFAATEFAAGRLPPNPMQLLIMPTLRAATIVVLAFAWTRRERPLAALLIAVAAVLFAGEVSHLYAVGFHAPAGVLAGLAACAGIVALRAMRGSS
jgi:hypothetical protein